MNALLKIEPRQGIADSVLLREIWKGLGIRKDYSDWAKVQLEMFEENKDFRVFPLKGENPDGGRPTIEHAVTIDCAKHICLMSRTEMGRKYRQYLIDFEREAREHTVLPDFKKPLEAFDAWAKAERRCLELEIDLAEAIRNKAQISDAKTATALAAASKATKMAEDMAVIASAVLQTPPPSQPTQKEDDETYLSAEGIANKLHVPRRDVEMWLDKEGLQYRALRADGKRHWLPTVAGLEHCRQTEEARFLWDKEVQLLAAETFTQV